MATGLAERGGGGGGGALEQGLGPLVDDELRVLHAAALRLGQRHHRVERPAPVRPVRRLVDRRHGNLRLVRLAKHRAHDQPAALAGRIWFGVDVALGGVGSQVRPYAEELAKVLSAAARVQPAELQVLDDLRRRAVVEQELVRVEAVAALHLGR
jgi:hypothetical protein